VIEELKKKVDEKMEVIWGPPHLRRVPLGAHLREGLCRVSVAVSVGSILGEEDSPSSSVVACAISNGV
jgi:hypothetical protein